LRLREMMIVPLGTCVKTWQQYRVRVRMSAMVYARHVVWKSSSVLSSGPSCLILLSSSPNTWLCYE
jgi:hypothetical protein